MINLRFDTLKVSISNFLENHTKLISISEEWLLSRKFYVLQSAASSMKFLDDSEFCRASLGRWWSPSKFPNFAEHLLERERLIQRQIWASNEVDAQIERLNEQSNEQ